MNEPSIKDAYYHEGFTPKQDKEAYQRDPTGNISASFDEATQAYLRNGKQDWDRFKDYMTFCFKRRYVSEGDARKWLDGLMHQSYWHILVLNGGDKIITEVINQAFQH